MQPQPGHLGCQLPSPANLRKFSWRRSEPSPATPTLPLLKTDEWTHLSPADYRRHTLFTACRQRLKRKHWRNTLFLCLNQLGLNPQVLAQTSPTGEQLSISPWEKHPPIPTVITPVDKGMSTSQQRELSLQTLASIPPADFQIFTDGPVRGGIEEGGVGLVVLCQDDLVHEWHVPTGNHSSSFYAEKATLREAIQFHHGPQPLSSWASAIVICNCKSQVLAVSNTNSADSSVIQLQAAVLAMSKLIQIVWAPGHCDMSGNELADHQVILQAAVLAMSKSIQIVWAPGHCGMSGKELADHQVKLQAAETQPDNTLEPATRRALVRRSCRPPPIQQERLKEVYSSLRH